MTRKGTLVRLDDAGRAGRLKELAAENDVICVEPDLSLLKLLQEEAVNGGNARFAMELARVRSDLFKNTETAKIKRGELLAKSVVLGIANQLAQILTRKVSGRFEGWEEVMDEAKEEFVTLICEAQNPERDEIP